MSNFGEDARESIVKHLTKTAATEIIKKIKNWAPVDAAIRTLAEDQKKLIERRL